MKINDIFSYNLKNILRNKKNIFYLIILIICVFILLTSLTFVSNLKNFIDKSIFKNIGFRTLSVQLKGEKEEISNLKSIKYVKDVYSSQYGSVFVETNFEDNKFDGVLELTYLDETAKNEIVDKENVKNFENNDYLICPLQFYPSSEAGMIKIANNDILDGNSFIGKNIEIYYSSYKLDENLTLISDKSYKKSFKIIGTYDNEKYMNLNNQCYASFSNIKEIVDIKSSINNNNTVYAFSIVVDKINNLNYVINTLKEMGYEEIEVKNQIDYEFVNKVNLICYCIVILIFVSIFFLTILYVNKKKNDDMFEMGILKVSGYNDRLLLKINFFENFLNVILEFVVGFVLFLILFLIAKFILFYNLSYLGFRLSLSFGDIIRVFLSVLITTTFVSTYFETRNLKKSISRIMESE